MARAKKEEKKLEKWKKVGITSGAIVMVLVVIFLLKLNFGTYLTSIFDALKAVFIPAALALFIAYLIRPMYKFLLKKTRLKKNTAAIVSIIIFFIIFLAFTGLIGYFVANQFEEVFSRIEADWDLIMENLKGLRNISAVDTFITEITNIDGKIDVELISGYIVSRSPELFSNAFSTTLSVLGKIIYWLIMIIMMPVFLFFFLREGDTIMSGIVKVIPKRYYRDDIEVMFKLANTSTEKYIRGKLLSIFALFIFFSITFSVTLVIFGQVPIMIAILYGILFGGIIAMLDLVPYIGPAIGIILPLFFIFISAESMIQFAIFGGVLIFIDFVGQNLQKMIIEPSIMSKEVEIHPLAVFSGLLFFGTLFGVVGFIVATPIVATIRSIYNYLNGKYSEEFIEDIIDEDINKDGVIAEVDSKV